MLFRSDAGMSSRTGFVRLKFGVNGPQIYSQQAISYINPIIHSIEPLMGIESGGTLLTIHGDNFTVGNSHISISIGDRPCQLLSISRTQMQCETTSFNPLLIPASQPVQFFFDHHTKLTAEKSFRIVPKPILHSFDAYHRFQSFMSGGHQLVVLGENFHIIQNIRLEFKRLVFVSPLFHNSTHLIFLSPSIQELHLNDENDYQQEIEIILHLDHFNQTSSLVYIYDPLIYELEPMLQTHTPELTIKGVNLTVLGHTKTDIFVHIGCDPCVIIQLHPDRIICRPPAYRPKKYSKTHRLCYESEHPLIIVTIDSIHSHVGYMVYPKRVIVLGKNSVETSIIALIVDHSPCASNTLFSS